MQNLMKKVFGRVMSRSRIGPKIGLVATLLTVSTMLAWAVDPFSVEAIKISSTSVPRNIADDLEPKGVLLSNTGSGVKKPLCEIFWTKVTPAAAVAHPATAHAYAGIHEGALVGVIHLLPEAVEDYNEDFNNQQLKTGYYTMRYAVLPAGVGEHGPEQGDFVVLSPIDEDRDPERTLTLDEMVRLGKLVSHGQEAARMELVRPENSKIELPGITVDNSAAATLHFKLHLARTKGVSAEELEVDLLVVTRKPDLGSNAS
jgi:hypothetical protein